ncbi:MAG: IS30 family transposase [Gallionella sp.]
MKPYTQLTSEQRYQISGLKKAGFTQAAIAREVGVHKSTLSRELTRNQGQRGWRPAQAQRFRDERKRACLNGKRFSAADWHVVDSLIRTDLSPEQVSNRLRYEGGVSICHETIYQHIYADKRLGGELHLTLRSQKPRRKRYGSGQERRGMIRNRVSIDARPDIVATRSRIGDWEGDTVIGQNHQGGLVTLAERKSRYVLAAPIRSKHAAGVTAQIKRLLAPHKAKCHTITFHSKTRAFTRHVLWEDPCGLDNGKEFAEHEQMATSLSADIYFAHPYHSWERGLNENSNGLLRQYFPKGMALHEITDEEVQRAVDKLNHRPRKVLGFRSPHEVFFGVQLSYVKERTCVALQS